MGSQQGFEQRSHDLTKVLTGSLRLMCWKETLWGQGLEQGDHLEVPTIMQVRDVNTLDHIGASETGDKMSNSVILLLVFLLFFVFSCPDTEFFSALGHWFSALLCLISIN